ASVGLRWQHLPSIDPAPGSSSIVQSVSPHNQFDVFGHWAITPTIDLRAGIDNVLDAAPEVVGAQTGVDNNRDAQMQFYDTSGLRYYAGMRARFLTSIALLQLMLTSL